MKGILALWICLASIAALLAAADAPPVPPAPRLDCFCVGTRSHPLTEAERDDVWETVLKYYTQSGHTSVVVFLSVPHTPDHDPTDTFMKRFHNFRRKVEKRSMAVKDDPPGEQVRHKITGERGIIVYAGDPTWETNGCLRVEIGHYMFSLGGGSDSFILSQSNGVWSVCGKIPGVMY